MASPRRLLGRTAISSIRSAVRSNVSSLPSRCAPRTTRFASTSSSRRISSFTRFPVELSCGPSPFPLHSAIALAQLSSCLSVNSQSCRALSQDNNDDS